MATDDQQVLVTGQAATPARFKVPGNGQLRPKAIFASYDGSGAAGDFLPAMKIISDGGEVVGIYPTSAAVVAGASADVSWFPRVAAAAAATTSTSIVYARAWNDSFAGDAAQSVAAGASAPASFAHTTTTDAAVISFSTSVNPNDTASLHANGTYLMFCGTHWDVAGPDLTSLILSVLGAGNAFPHNPIDPGTNPTFGDTIGSATSQDFAVMHKTSGGELENVLLGNQDVAAHLAQQCYFVIIYLATA